MGWARRLMVNRPAYNGLNGCRWQRDAGSNPAGPTNFKKCLDKALKVWYYKDTMKMKERV